MVNLFLIIFFIKLSSTINNNILLLHNSLCSEIITNTVKNERRILIIYDVDNSINELKINNSDVTIINLKHGVINMSHYIQFNVIILYLKSPKDIDNIINNTYSLKNWNPRAKFILNLNKNENLDKIFQFSWNFYIINIIVITEEDEEIYTYFPYQNSQCGNNITAQIVGHCYDKLNYKNIFPEKVPQNLQGCQLNLAAIDIAPMVINVTAPKDDPTLAGIELTTIHTIAKWMNLTDIHTKRPLAQWGHQLQNETANPLYESLKEKEFDVIYGYSIAVYWIDNYIEMSTSHLSDTSNCWVPVASRIAVWKNIIIIFKGSLWLIILFMLILNGLIWLIVKPKKNNFFEDLTWCLFNSLCVLVQNSPNAKRIGYFRIMFASWCFTTFVLYVAYTSKLYTFLNRPLYEKQISSIKELLESNLKLQIEELSDVYFSKDDPVQKQLLDVNVICNDIYLCLADMASSRNVSVFINRKFMDYVMGRNFALQNGKLPFYEIKELEIRDILVYEVLKGFPLLDRINTLILRLQQAGFLTKWLADIQNLAAINLSPELDNFRISINHLECAFYILLIGLFVALCSFIIEIFIRNIHNRINEDTVNKIFNI